MRITHHYEAGAFAAWAKGGPARMARAATAAIREASELGKQAARQSMAAGGFGSKWQNAVRVKLYPPSGDSLKPATLIYSKIRYSRVFEEGATISGKPILWLPIEQNLPRQAGGHAWTPLQYQANVGPLVSVNRPGHAPLLFGLIKVTKRGKAIRTASRQRDMGTPARMKLLPLFVGVSSVTDPKKFDAIAAIRGVGARIPELYRKHIQNG